jgi:hypothetical protein
LFVSVLRKRFPILSFPGALATEPAVLSPDDVHGRIPVRPEVREDISAINSGAIQGRSSSERESCQ